MKSNLKKHILMTALNIVVVVVYFAISFFALPNIPGIGKSISTDLDVIIISLPILLISIIMMINEQHLWLWIVPDIIYCVLMITTSNDNYHPYGIGVFGFDPLNRAYERDIALIESIIVLAIMLIVQSVAKLLTRLIKRKKEGGKGKS